MKVKVFIFFLVFGFLGFTATSRVFGKENNAPVCPGPTKNNFRCHARVVTDPQGKPNVTITPSGYGPFQFRGAYNLTGTAFTTQTIAIVDAYNQPNILSDLNTYSRQFGIPQMNSCAVSAGTAASPCFQKVDQNGGTNYPGVNSGWALETSLDVEVAHAICQNCNILLVEATSATYADLMAAVDRARLMGATVISNSYGSSEFSSQTTLDSHFNYPGTAFTFSSGDSGYGPSYPAGSQYVTAVGGTTLNIDSGNNYVSESAWSGSGSGCSVYESKPSWQTDTLCANRTIADVSADADPSTGAAVYSSVKYQGRKGWFKVGGTSLSSPLIAGVYALSGNTGNATTYGSSIPYSNPSFLHDIMSGANGSCGGTYLCTALSGYDGPTGLGTPKGIGGF